MSQEPFVGEVQAMAFPFPPKGWAWCQGQLLPIQQNQALFSLLGTTYGGNGIQTFGLPNLSGRVPIGVGQGPGLPSVALGEIAGEAAHRLTIDELPAHTHQLRADASTAGGSNNYLPTSDASLGQSVLHQSRGADTALNVYSSDLSNLAPLASATVATAGSNQGHENRQPFLTLNFCIALTGIFPSRG